MENMNNNKTSNQKDSPKVSIVILNWNNWKDTLECLESIFQINYSFYNVVLVDNASTDHSIPEIRDFSTSISREIIELNENEIKEVNIHSKNNHIHNFTENLIKNNVNSADFKPGNHNRFGEEYIFGKNLFLIKNNENHGFTGGNNIGMNFALEHLNPDYILLLNNDTTVRKNFLDEMLKVAGSNDSVGSVQAVLLNHNGKAIDSLGQECYWWGAEDICMGTSPNVQGFVDESTDIMEIFGSCAAAALCPSKVLRKTGLFDDAFFVELEDVDLSWRIRLMGYKSYLASKSLVYHKRGVSGTITSGDIVRGLANKSMIGKWYHQSKNWLIIVLRYYPLSVMVKALFRYPHKVFFTFFRLIYSSIWLGKTEETFKILLNNSKNGKKIKKNPYWVGTVRKWVKKNPRECNWQK